MQPVTDKDSSISGEVLSETKEPLNLWEASALVKKFENDQDSNSESYGEADPVGSETDSEEAYAASKIP